MITTAGLLPLFFALACATPPAEPAPPVRTLVLLGDSITAGAGASTPEHAYAFRLARALGARYRVVDYARGGWTVAGRGGFGEPAFVRGAAFLMPDVVVIVLGTNDYGVGVPLEKFEPAYRRMLSHLGAETRVACVTPFRRSDADEVRPNTAGLVPRDYREAVRRTCEAAGHSVLDGFEALPSAAFLPDGLHPNDAGHERIAEWMGERLSELDGAR